MAIAAAKQKCLGKTEVSNTDTNTPIFTCVFLYVKEYMTTNDRTKTTNAKMQRPACAIVIRSKFMMETYLSLVVHDTISSVEKSRSLAQTPYCARVTDCVPYISVVRVSTDVLKKSNGPVFNVPLLELGSSENHRSFTTRCGKGCSYPWCS